MSLREIVQENLKTAREEAGLSMRALADAVGCSKQAIYEYESGRSFPSDTMMERIAEKLDRPAWWFYRPFRPNGGTPGSVMITDEEGRPVPWEEVSEAAQILWLARRWNVTCCKEAARFLSRLLPVDTGARLPSGFRTIVRFLVTR